MKIATKSKLADSFMAQFTASASAWRGRLVFTFLEHAKINSPLQSLATTAIAELMDFGLHQH